MQRVVAPGSSSESLVEQQAVAAAGAAQQRESFSPLPRRCSSAITSVVAPCARAAPAEPSREALSSTITSVSNGTAARSRAIESRQ